MAEDAHKSQDAVEGKVLEEFYQTLERRKKVYDKFYDQHHSSFIQDTNNENTKDDVIENIGSQYKKEPFIDQSRRFTSQTNDAGRKLAIDYLVGERKIAPSIVNTMIDQDIIRAENNDKYHYIEFAWKKPSNEEESNAFTNKDQQVVGADRMNFEPDKNGKMVRRSRENGGQTIAKNSESDYGFNIKTGTGKDNLFIFEAPVDALSYATLNGRKLAGTNSTLLSLGGVSKIDSIQSFIHKQHGQNKDFKNIIIGVDKDHAGRQMIGNFTQCIENKEEFVNHPDKYYHHVYIKQANVGKDWNDTLKATDRFIHQNNKDDTSLASQLSHKNRYNIDDYMLQRTKRMMNGDDFHHVIVNHVQSLNSMYSSFQKNHDINFYGKDYSVYKNTTNQLSDNFKEYMSEFGKNMQPKELNRYIQESINNVEITPNERENINAANRLKKQNKIKVLNDFVLNETLHNNPSLKALDDYNAILKAVQKNNHLKVEPNHKEKLKNDKDIKNMKNIKDNIKDNNGNTVDLSKEIGDFSVNNDAKNLLNGKKKIVTNHDQSKENNVNKNTLDDGHVNHDLQQKLKESWNKEEIKDPKPKPIANKEKRGLQNDNNDFIKKAQSYGNEISLATLTGDDLKGNKINNDPKIDHEPKVKPRQKQKHSMHM